MGVVDKAAAVLDALEAGPLVLAELTEATGLPRATAHRLVTALEAHALVGRTPSGSFILGPRLQELGRSAAGGDRARLSGAAVGPLAQLRDATGESTQLYVAEGGSRVCLVSLESPHSLRTIVAVGASLPMDRGSAGRALTADPAATRQGWVQSVEERERGVASVSAPVVVDGAVVAAVSVSGPLERTSRAPGRRYGAAVVVAARAVEARLA